MVKPAPAAGARGDLLLPHVDAGMLLREPAQPDAVDEHPRTVRGLARLVNALKGLGDRRDIGFSSPPLSEGVHLALCGLRGPQAAALHGVRRVSAAQLAGARPGQALCAKDRRRKEEVATSFAGDHSCMVKITQTHAARLPEPHWTNDYPKGAPGARRGANVTPRQTGRPESQMSRQDPAESDDGSTTGGGRACRIRIGRAGNARRGASPRFPAA